MAKTASAIPLRREKNFHDKPFATRREAVMQ